MLVAIFCCKIKFVNTIKLQQPNYTANGTVYQLVIPMDIEEIIPLDDSVRLAHLNI